MSFANKYNKGGIKWNIDTRGFDYHNLKELQVGECYKIYGFYINNKSKFGAYPVAILVDGFLNLPEHLLSDVKEMLVDPETIETIKNGGAGIKVVKYTAKKYNRECLSVEWIDM